MASESFDHYPAASTARGFHAVANYLLRVLSQTMNPQTINSIPPETTVGMASSSAVLQAIAIEILLKAIGRKVGAPFKQTHNHVRLFSVLPKETQAACRARYKARMDASTITDKESLIADFDRLLASSANMFVDWRYIYEAHSAGLGYRNREMQLAFEALAEVYSAL